jgi:hypothetical protein
MAGQYLYVKYPRISWEILRVVLRGGGYTFYSRILDDVEGFFSISDIFFTSHNKTKNKPI